MSATLFTLSTVAFVLAGVSLVLAVFFWFHYRIPSVFGDLTGRTAKKSIAAMRAANEKEEKKKEKAKKDKNKTPKKTNVKAPPQEQILETGLLQENQIEKVQVKETDLLVEATTKAEVSDETDLLIDGYETAPLEAGTGMAASGEGVAGKRIEMIEEVVLTHTNENI